MGLVPRHWLRPTYGQISVNAFCCPPLARACHPPQSHSDIEDILHSPPAMVHPETGDLARASEDPRRYNSRAGDFAADVVPTESYLLSESNTLSRIKSEPVYACHPAKGRIRLLGREGGYGVSSESRRNGVIALLYSTTLFPSLSSATSNHFPLMVLKRKERFPRFRDSA